jgi:REP element-mobilizing transposase RayT
VRRPNLLREIEFQRRILHRREFISRGEQIHAFCLMSHHFHLVVETPRANLSAGMRWFLGRKRRLEAVAAWVVLGAKDLSGRTAG